MTKDCQGRKCKTGFIFSESQFARSISIPKSQFSSPLHSAPQHHRVVLPQRSQESACHADAVAMAAASSWGDPGYVLLGRIARFFPCLGHRALFGAVCKNWRMASIQNRPRKHLPWLLLPSSTAAEQEPCFFCLLCRRRHPAALPDDVRGARCIASSPDGWLLLALQQSGGYAFHNLHDGCRYYLPEVLRTPNPFNDHRMVIHAACGATRHEDREVIYIAAIGAWSASSIAFWRITVAIPGSEEHDSWGEILPRGSIADALYYSGHGLEGFHVLTDDEEILVYVPGRAPDGALTMRLVTYFFPTHEVTTCAITRYLVNYVNELLMVARTVTPDEWTRAFHVFKLVPELPLGDYGDRPASWETVPVIPTGIIILGRCCSRSYPTYGLPWDGVYFLDDATSSQDAATRALEPAATRQYPCSDMGWLPLVSHDIQRIFPIRLPSESSRAVWFHP